MTSLPASGDLLPVNAGGLVEHESVPLSLRFGFAGFILLQRVEIFQEQEPGDLFGTVHLDGATGFFPEHIVDMFEDVFRHMEGFPATRGKLARKRTCFPVRSQPSCERRAGPRQSPDMRLKGCARSRTRKSQERRRLQERQTGKLLVEGKRDRRKGQHKYGKGNPSDDRPVTA